MGADELAYLSAAEAAPRLRSGELSPRDLVDAHLARIEVLNLRLNAFVSVVADAARAAARDAEAEIQSGHYRGPLHGIPMGVKDIFATGGLRTAAGSKILGDWVPDHDSTAVERLRQAGAILLGKTNTHEFAFGVTTNNPHFGPSRNPWDPARVPGGSSGGSAVAVAAGMCPVALGSDTGGSIRLPAAVTATVGIKPTYGRVSRFGVVPLSWSCDHIGPITRSVEDAALVLNAIAGHDARDPRSANVPVPDYAHGLDEGMAGLRLGLLKEQFQAPMDPEVEHAVHAAALTLERLGAHVEEISYPEHDLASTANSVILFAEAASVHERWLRERPDTYGEDVRQRLQQGALLPASAYLRAQRARSVLIDRFKRLFERVDAVISPSVPIAPPPISEPTVAVGGAQVEVRATLTRHTRAYDLLGNPAVSVPCGFTTAGLPIGLQVAGRWFDEATVLRVAYAYEQVTRWSARRPPL